MLLSYFQYAFLWAVNLTFAAAGYFPPDLVVRNPSSSAASQRIARRALLPPTVIRKREVFESERFTLQKSWEDAVLFSHSVERESQSQNNPDTTVDVGAGLEITCVRCYVKGAASARLEIEGDFDFTTYIEGIKDEFDNFTSQVGDEIETFAMEIIDDIGETVTDLITGGDLESQFDSLANFSISPDLNVVVPDIPESTVVVELEDLELYMLLNTRLTGAASYSLNLYSSMLPIGGKLTDSISAGVTISVDLILSCEAEIDINTGVHIKIDRTVIELPLFHENIASIMFDGGQFEFLPVTIEGADVELKAVLQIGAFIGLEAGFGYSSSINDRLDVGVGAEAGIFANVAEFITSVKIGNDDCDLAVEEVYQFAVGAAAGASVVWLGTTWGPVPETSTPIFSTTLAEVCAEMPTPTTTTAAAIDLEARGFAAKRDLTTTTISTKMNYTAVACKSTGMVNCPASLQETTKYTTTSYLTTAVSEGVEASFPVATQNTTVNTIAFGTNAILLERTSGVPVQPTPTSASVNDKNGKNMRRIVIGVTVGVGIPLLAAAIGVCIYFKRRGAVKK